MVGKYKVKNHLTLAERRQIREGVEADLSYRRIAEDLGRAKSTIIRECKRLGDPQDYDPLKAHQNFKKKQMLSGIKRGSSLYLKILEIEIDDEGE
jgi:IS30 family transposase